MPLLLLVSYSGLLGGAERVLLDFGASLSGERTLACPDGPLARQGAADGFRVLPLTEGPLEFRGGLVTAARAVRGLARHGREVRALIDALDPDVVVVSGMRSGLAVLGAHPPGVPVVFDHHDLLPGRKLGWAVRRSARRAAVTVVPSGAVAEDLGSAGVVQIVPPGVALERFDPRAAPVSPPQVLTLGSIVPWKRPDLAVAAVAAARRRAPSLEIGLRLGGAPLPGGEDLRAQLGDAASGPVEDVPAALAAASCLLHCAPREPFGVVLVEALAAGRPVIAPAAGGPLEILDESCGIFYPPGDAEAAGAALASLLGDRARLETMGRAGRRRAAERFDVRRSRAAFASSVRPLIRQRPARRGRELAIITVSHNSAPQLAALLSSAARHLPGAEMVVADCASTDASVDVARAHGARVLVLGENVGFGTGCNRALAEIGAPACALLNPDVELVDDSLAGLAADAVRHDRLLAPLVLNADGSRQDTVHPLPASAAELVRAVVPYTRLGVTALAPWRARSPRPVGWAIGAALVARTGLLRSFGPFDETLFMYGEDLDLALRARATGVPTWFDPRARVVHHGAHSTEAAFGGEAVERLAWMRREVVRRRLGPAATRREDATGLMRYASRIAARRLLGRPAGRERAQLRALWALCAAG